MPWTGIAVQLHNAVRQPFFLPFYPVDFAEICVYGYVLLFFFFPSLSATAVCPGTLVVTGGQINFQKTWCFVSSAVVRLINDVIKGSDPKSDASVSAAKGNNKT
jgi:hypothetical protein